MCIYSGVGVHHSVYALGSSGIGQFIVSVFILAVVIVLCYFTTRFIANYQKGIVGKGNIEILEAKSLGNNKYIEIGKEITMKIFKAIGALFAVILALFGITFAAYWFNLDMKLIRKIYDALQPHYDNLEKDRKL